MSAATLTSAATSAAATTSAQDIVNGQINLDAALNVVVSGNVDQADGSNLSAVTLGNAVTVDVVERHDVANAQDFSGSANAEATMTGNQLDGTSFTTSVAMANTADLTHDNGMDLTSTQTARDGAAVSARSSYLIGEYGMGSVTTATAAANAVESMAYGDTNRFDVDQDSGANVSAEAVADAPTGGLGNMATLAAVASGNTSRFEGYHLGPEQEIDLDQDNRGDVRATGRVNAGGGAIATTAATQAAGNTASVQNENGDVTMTGDQNNAGAVDAETEIVLGNFDIDTVTGSSEALGNSVIISNIGADVATGVGQTNTGVVNASTSFQGGAGGVAILSANAFGNAQTTYICSECPVTAYGTTNQTNSANVTATVTGSMQGGPMLIGTASAIGNTATYQTVTPQSGNADSGNSGG